MWKKIIGISALLISFNSQAALPLTQIIDALIVQPIEHLVGEPQVVADSSRNGGFARYIKATGNRVFVFDPQRFSWAAYDEKGRLLKTGEASGGKDYCADVKRRCRTPVGQFSVYRKGSASCVSSKFPLGRGGAPMPYCMFFRGGYAIHGSPNVPNHNASHGCIRVKPDAAHWLHSNFIRNGTTVIVRPY